MAVRRLGKTWPLLLALLLVLLAGGTGKVRAQIRIDAPASGSSSNLALAAVPEQLLRSALAVVEDLDWYRHRSASLVAARKLTKATLSVYKLTFFLEQVCGEEKQDACPRDSCTIDVLENEQGLIDVQRQTIVCRQVYSQASFDPPASKKSSKAQLDEQQQLLVETIEKQMINSSSSLDREVQISSEHNDRPFTAVRANQSDYCPGCPYELNPSLPGLMAFGDQAVRSMDEAGRSDFKHKLVSIIKVTRAVPPNANVVRYQLLMEIGESNCLRSVAIEVSECSLRSNIPIKLCLVSFEERPPIPASRRITKNNCTDSLNPDNDNELSSSVDPNLLFLHRASSAPGKEEDHQEDGSAKPELFYDQIAQEAQEVFRMPNMHRVPLPKKDQEEGAPKFSEDKLKELDEFLEDFDLPIRRESSSSTASPVTETILLKQLVDADQTTRSKRAVGAKALDNGKAAIRKLAIKAVQMVDDVDQDDKKKHLLEVLGSVRERRTGGLVYRLSLELAATDCREDEASTECLDELIPGASEICKLEILVDEKKALESPKLLRYSCKNKAKRSKRQLLGGASSYDGPEIKELLEQGLRQFAESYEGSQEPVVHRVKKVTRQVVAGYLYKITLEFGPSSCKRHSQEPKENCRLLEGQALQECTIEAWTRSWVDDGKPKLTLDCPAAAAAEKSSSSSSSARERRSLRGVDYSGKMLQQARQLKEEKLFREFVAEYKRSYASEAERAKRFEIFRQNLDMIEELQRNEQGTGRYGVTRFADLSKAEFKSGYLGLRTSLGSENDIPMPRAEIPELELPPEFDWRQRNAVTPVKNQGQCGSCWAFSVTGNVEGQYAIKHGQLLSFSEQELVDCDKLDEGCSGGLPDQAYRAIEELGGLELEADYPYEAENDKCHFNKSKIRASVVSGLNITGNETQMAQWLVKNGPMSIGINANAMQFYIGGVSHPFHFLCSPSDLDHGVLIVGYGVKSYPIFKKTLPYWLIKNSWGPHWGERGYYRVYRGDGTCGVNKMVTSAVLA